MCHSTGVQAQGFPAEKTIHQWRRCNATATSSKSTSCITRHIAVYNLDSVAQRVPFQCNIHFYTYLANKTETSKIFHHPSFTLGCPTGAVPFVPVAISPCHSSSFRHFQARIFLLSQEVCKHRYITQRHDEFSVCQTLPLEEVISSFYVFKASATWFNHCCGTITSQ